MRRDGVANREKILAAAEQVFGSVGTEASTDEVARRAGVGVATVFRHFPTKQALVGATAERYLEKLEVEVRRQLDAADPGAALTSVLRTLVATGPTKVTLLNLLLADGHGLGVSILASVEVVRDEVRQVLDRARDAGAVRPDATVALVLTLARALAHVGPPDDHEAVEQALQVVLDGLAVPRGGAGPRETESSLR